MKKRMRSRRPLTAWEKSAEFRAIAVATLRKLNAERHLLPKCKAKAKSTGDRCKQPALANGTCQYHGGRTPKGNDWHVTQWPAGGAADAELKLDRKLKARQRAATAKARRLASMSEQERQRHSAWQKTHKPGRATDRVRSKKERADAAAFAASVDAPAAPISSEQARLADELRALRYTVAILEGEGIFG